MKIRLRHPWRLRREEFWVEGHLVMIRWILGWLEIDIGEVEYEGSFHLE